MFTFLQTKYIVTLLSLLTLLDLLALLQRRSKSHFSTGDHTGPRHTFEKVSSGALRNENFFPDTKLFSLTRKSVLSPKKMSDSFLEHLGVYGCALGGVRVVAFIAQVFAFIALFIAQIYRASDF